VGCGSSSNSNNNTTDSNLPNSLNILPIMSDEDGSQTDAKATYTLTANKNVDVTISSPHGDWVTPMWRYNNNPLPLLIKAKRGDKMTLNFKNKLDADSTIHWHGFKIPAKEDGGPDFPVKPNENKTYSFTLDQPASPLWFHPHPDMQTGKQVYMGLAGVFIVEDDISKELEETKQLPSGEKDVVLLVQDRRFDALKEGKKELLYRNQSMDMDGMLGDVVLVNGSEFPSLAVSTSQYRFRLYNVSNAKNYDFAFDDGREFTVVATDGGFLKEPVKLEHIQLGAAQRVEIIVDFSKDDMGESLKLISRAFMDDNMDMGSMSSNGSDMNDMGGRSPNGTAVDIMQFTVTKKVTDDITLYTTLSDKAEITKRLDPTLADNIGNERAFVMTMKMGNSGMSGSGMMPFVINGKSFDANRVDEFIEANSTEIWSLKNDSTMAHPFHAHAIQYQILDRDGVPASGVDLGWKDTFLVQAGETVRVIGRFEPVNQGDYMYHCHILEHEDDGMMGYFRVGNSGNVGK
jgi:FtsP/CotA-like multicopper oxidase with cupredoxin domain